MSNQDSNQDQAEEISGEENAGQDASTQLETSASGDNGDHDYDASAVEGVVGTTPVTSQGDPEDSDNEVRSIEAGIKSRLRVNPTQTGSAVLLMHTLHNHLNAFHLKHMLRLWQALIENSGWKR